LEKSAVLMQNQDSWHICKVMIYLVRILDNISLKFNQIYI